MTTAPSDLPKDLASAHAMILAEWAARMDAEARFVEQARAAAEASEALAPIARLRL